LLEGSTEKVIIRLIKLKQLHNNTLNPRW